QDEAGNPILLPIDDDSTADDSLGGTAFYLGRAEVEIPLGSGARELGIRPSLFVDVGSVFGVKTPQLNVSPFPDGIFLPFRDASGNALYSQVDAATVQDGVCIATAFSTVTTPINPNPPACLASPNNTALGNSLPP